MKPCSECPWVSRDLRDQKAVSDPDVQNAMKSGVWFCCHVNLETCHGAVLLHNKHQRQAKGVST